MNKYLRKAMGLGLAMAVLLAAAAPALATGLTAGSDAEVEFTVSTAADAFVLENVPDLDFGSHELQVTNYYYAAKSISMPLEVHDRRGSATGWNVMVDLEEFEDSSSAVGLQAAQIIFKSLNNYAGATTTGSLGATAGITGPAAGTPSVFPTAPATVVTAAATPVAVKIFTAPANTGVGMWAAHWMPDSASSEGAASTGKDIELLVIGGTASADAYTAVMNWVLADTP